MRRTADSKSANGGLIPSTPAIFIGASPSGKAADSDSAYRWSESISPCQLWPFSSVGQSRRLIIVLSTVQVSEGPPFIYGILTICTQNPVFGYTFPRYVPKSAVSGTRPAIQIVFYTPVLPDSSPRLLVSTSMSVARAAQRITHWRIRSPRLNEQGISQSSVTAHSPSKS